MGEDPDGRSYSELTRLEQIIARATARIQEERKKRRAFVRRKTRILSMYNPYNYLRACYWTRIGKVVLWPNEVTYGLTTNGLLDDSVQAIYDAKGRVANPIPVLTCKGWIRHFGFIPRLAQDLVDAFWPDNISIVVPKRREIVSDLMTAGIESVALMCPNEPAERLAYDVCRAGAEIVPVACTSANISGQKSITDAASAIEKFNGAVDVILTGPESSVGVNTTIIDFSSEPYTFLRAGPVSLDEVFAVVPELSGKIVDCTRKQ
jgi:L-threonylcarbamoyladenylate synthase